MSCHSCNEFKGAQHKVYDLLTGRQAPLFHPRQQPRRRRLRWSEDGATILGRTASGRATIAALQMNHPAIVGARRRWVSVGWHPPGDDRTQ